MKGRLKPVVLLTRTTHPAESGNVIRAKGLSLFLIDKRDLVRLYPDANATRQQLNFMISAVAMNPVYGQTELTKKEFKFDPHLSTGFD